MNHHPTVDYKLIFDTLPGLYLILAPDLSIMAVSDAYAEATLTKRELIVGHHLFDIFPDNPTDGSADGVSNLNQSLQYVLKSGKQHKMAVQKYDIRRPDGVFEERYWSPINVPVFNTQQELLYIIHKVTDVTANYTTTEKLKESEKDYQLLISTVKDYAIFMITTDGMVASWNKGAENIKGYKADEIITKPITLFYTESDREKGIPDANLHSASEYGHFETEGWRLRKDGCMFWAHVVITALKNQKGELYGYTKITRDITEQKNLREQITHLANIVDQSSEAIISRGLDRRLISWNKGAEELFGFTKEEAIGKTTMDLKFIQSPAEEIKEFEQQINEKGFWKAEKPLYHKNGHSFTGQISANAVKNEHGEITSIVSVIKDISVSKLLEKTLKETNFELEEKILERTKEIKKSELKYLLLFEDNPLPIWVMDTETLQFIAVNKMATRHYGYSREEFLSMTALDIRPEEDKEHFKNLDRSKKSDDLNYNKGVWRHRKKNGSLIYVEIIAHQIEFEGKKARIVLAHDVTERKAIEDKITANERRFRALIENSHDIITLMDGNFQLLYRSPGATRIMGWTNEDMLGIDATKNIHPDDLSYAAEIIKEVFSSPSKSFYTRFRMLHKMGHYLWLEGTLTNLLQDESVKAIVFNFRNITERVEAEEKLKNSERQFRSRLDNMLEGIQIHDFNWQYIYVNEALVKFSKYERNELIGHTLLEKYPGIEQTALFATLQRCMTERVAEQLETEFVFPDGSKADYQLSLQPVPEGLFILSIDITERKRTANLLMEREAQLKLFIDHSPASLAMFDQEMNYINASQRWLNEYNLTSENTIGRSHYDIFPEIEQRWKDIHVRCLQGNIEKSENDVFIRADGQLNWLRWEVRPWYKASGEIGGIIMFSENITEKKKAEDAIRKSNERFELVVKATNDVIWDWDLQTNKVWRNKNYFTHFGYDELKTAKDAGSLHEGIFNEDKERVVAGINNCINEKKHFWTDEYRYIKKDGTLAYVLDCGYILYNEAGEAYRMAGAMLDITRRKEAEQDLKRSADEIQALAERMSIILNTLPANIALLDGNGTIIDVNDGWRNFADSNGYLGANYCIGDNYLELSKKGGGEDNDEGSKIANGIKAVIHQTQNEFVLEYACHSPKIKRWFKMIVTPLKEKEMAGAVVMHIDISELRMLEEERLKTKLAEQKKVTKAMLMGQEKERNHIGQELHDNINQILVSTKLYLSMAGGKNETLLELVKYPMELLDTSIQEIRQLCHKMVTPIKNINLRELIEELLKKLDQNSAITTKLIYDGDEALISDDLKLNIYRIAQELINNILKYADASNVLVTVKATKKQVILAVTDDGKGFDPEKKRKGIGISNMHSRAESFNGTIEIVSSAGKGCKTTVQIPC